MEGVDVPVFLCDDVQDVYNAIDTVYFLNMSSSVVPSLYPPIEIISETELSVNRTNDAPLLVIPNPFSSNALFTLVNVHRSDSSDLNQNNFWRRITSADDTLYIYDTVVRIFYEFSL